MLRAHISLFYRVKTVFEGQIPTHTHTPTHLGTGVSTNGVNFQFMAISMPKCSFNTGTLRVLSRFYHGSTIFKHILKCFRASKSPNSDTWAGHAASADGERRCRQRWKMDLSTKKNKQAKISKMCDFVQILLRNSDCGLFSFFFRSLPLVFVQNFLPQMLVSPDVH